MVYEAGDDKDPPPEKWLNMDRAVASAIRKEQAWVTKSSEKASEQLKKAEAALGLKVPDGQEKRAANEQSILKSAVDILTHVVSGSKTQLQNALAVFSGVAATVPPVSGPALSALPASTVMIPKGSELVRIVLNLCVIN